MAVNKPLPIPQSKEKGGSIFTVLVVGGLSVACAIALSRYVGEDETAPEILDCAPGTIHKAVLCTMAVVDYERDWPLVVKGKHNQKLEDDNKDFMTRKDRLAEQRDTADRKAKRLERENGILQTRNKEQIKINNDLKAKITRLEARMNIAGEINPEPNPDYAGGIILQEIKTFREQLGFEHARYDTCSGAKTVQDFFKCADDLDWNNFNKSKIIRKKHKKDCGGRSFRDGVYCTLEKAGYAGGKGK